MILFSICLVTVLLFCLITWQSPIKYVKKLREVNWHRVMAKIKFFFRHLIAQLGRYVMRPILKLYYSIFSPEVPFFDKLIIYAGLIYIVWPIDLLPCMVYRMFGFTDDIMAIALVNIYIKHRMPPSVSSHVEMTLQRWFGFDCFVPT